MKTTESKAKSGEHQGHSTATSSVVDSARQTCESFEKCVEDNPGSALMISTVIGLGIGILIGRSLGSSHKPEPLGWFDSRTAEKMGHQFLSAMSRYVPESISSRLS